MNIDTAESPVRIVLDTNILISAIGFGGKPRHILRLILDKQLTAVTSAVLLAELEDVITKKFPTLEKAFPRISKQIRKRFHIVKPKKTIRALTDEPDNRVLEAAVTGRCTYLVTGDKELLNLGIYKNIKIVSPEVFLKEMQS